MERRKIRLRGYLPHRRKPHPDNPAVAFRAREERNNAIRDLFQSTGNWSDLHGLFDKYKIPSNRFQKETEKYEKAYQRAEDRGTEPPDEHEWAERIQYAAGDDVDEWVKKQGSVPRSAIQDDTEQNQIRNERAYAPQPQVGQTAQPANAPQKPFLERAFDKLKGFPIVARAAERFKPMVRELRESIEAKFRGLEFG